MLSGVATVLVVPPGTEEQAYSSHHKSWASLLQAPNLEVRDYFESRRKI